jgi:cytochrome oxidase Cu insertion factor (SCO1/SenC/PrrC family)
VVNFIFTRCAGPCLSLTAEMARLQEELKERDLDVRLVTITVDPDYDTPEILKKYAEGFGADPGQWLFLTGDKDKIYQLIRDSFKMPVKEMKGAERKPGWEVLHTTNILLVDAEGKVLGKYNGVEAAEVSKLIRTLRDLPGTSGGAPAETVPDDAVSQEARAGETVAAAEEN